MKTESKVILVIIAFVLALFLASAIVYNLLFKPTPLVSPINSPAIAEWQQTLHVREVLSPSVFVIKIKVFAIEKDKATQKEKETLCEKGGGTAYTVSENGYFSTNNHVVDPSLRQTECRNILAKQRNVRSSTLNELKFRIETIFIGTDKISFPVEIVKAFPEIDMAVLKPLRTKAVSSLPKKWIPVEFRTGSPKVVNGEIVTEKGPMILPDEPVAVIGTPLGFSFTITNGKLGNNTFFEFGKTPFFHFIAAINSGNSGGLVISYLDFKPIGMVTMTKKDHGVLTEQAGAIPFWVIQNALKEVDMK